MQSMCSPLNKKCGNFALTSYGDSLECVPAAADHGLMVRKRILTKESAT